MSLDVYKGKWALVTGASAGIGSAIAEELARAGANLILSARRADRITELSARLALQYRVATLNLVEDLNDPAAPQRIYNATEGEGIDVDILINNAGLGLYGEFASSSLEQEMSMVQVNCAAPVHLTRLIVPRMVKRRRGWIMMLGSTASFQPVPYMATYAATKVFDRYLAEALSAELAQHNILVTSLNPGPTVSEFGQVAGTRKNDFRKRQSAQDVARIGLEALASGRNSKVPYLAGRLQAFAMRLFPHSVINKIAEKKFRPGPK